TLVAASGPLLVRVTVKVTVSPTLGVVLLTDLVTARSAARGVAGALAMVFRRTGSNWSAPTVTKLSVGGGVNSSAGTVKVARAPSARSPTTHVPRPASSAPRPTVWPTKANPGGNRSWTTTLVASSGPWLVTVTV